MIEVWGKLSALLGQLATDSPEHRERAHTMIDEAIAKLTPLDRGAGGMRGHGPGAGQPLPPIPPKPGTGQADAGTQATAAGAEPCRGDTVRALRNSESFADKAPATVYHELLDEGVCVASISTMYRFLRARNEVKERRRQAVHPVRAKPELIAEASNRVWSWDITKLRGPAKWSAFHLYVIIEYIQPLCDRLDDRRLGIGRVGGETVGRGHHQATCRP